MTNYRRCKDYRLATLFPARAIALGCVYVVMNIRGLQPLDDRKQWVDDIGSRKVDIEDFEELLEVMRAV